MYHTFENVLVFEQSARGISETYLTVFLAKSAMQNSVSLRVGFPTFTSLATVA